MSYHFDRDFPVARIGRGTAAHYIDNYRYSPGRSICGKPLTEPGYTFLDEPTLPLCNPCARSRHYPTETEYREYGMCTDCGVDARALGETAYRVRNKVWHIAYPHYKSGVGVGSSRPCIGCLEQRLGRTLAHGDFDMDWGPEPWLSDRLNDRLMR